MHQENLITKLGRAIDEYWAERKQTTSEVYIDSSSWQQYRRWLPSRGNVLFTTFMIGLLIWAQSTGAIGLFASNGTNASSIGTNCLSRTPCKRRRRTSHADDWHGVPPLQCSHGQRTFMD